MSEKRPALKLFLRGVALGQHRHRRIERKLFNAQQDDEMIKQVRRFAGKFFLIRTERGQSGFDAFFTYFLRATLHPFFC